ncbi:MULTISPECIES: TetR family transcriptional regulator C-terminal domain-containing protein [Rhizobium/Agrobacterium group]|uniref:TetR family transcriptional regulator C-terminal domain-containing protein n=1 Tax=Rhizobium/Agrobacterium group TaxID=227290 RepID=UPI001ADD3B44|nr:MULTISPECIES: TetR family transcriptional regulator C-terminal domain-containing protein [Rhizobium/Agrobacterium group]MBO9112435.1 TetR family transcriptional regulator C-terminal domain-containing protein [Agrobacterium sp. S2/73]QXZ75943.1 TetR family transcriptional regulator C-terminal domain-containing protein [Agrobacterium sp. S7/73]QYA17046.1 TetR family transcriptional regulator C-terminal domain-containing protein [Rhizobium sp. AB2/73]UEQ85381.1 TetR family transcriptional regul
MSRATFHRAPEAERRQELIEATLDCIAEAGLEGATVRQIALRAGVTAGLLRHYFESKEEMVAEAYRSVVATFAAKAVDMEGTPGRQLRDFITLNLTAPVANNRTLSIWAAFIGKVRVDATLAAIHRQGYLDFRDDLQGLIANFLRSRGRTVVEVDCRRLAIAINGMIDGLWLEACLAHELFTNSELATVAVSTVESLLGLEFEPIDEAAAQERGQNRAEQ